MKPVTDSAYIETNPEIDEEQDSEFNLADYWSVVVKRRWLILASVTIASAIALISSLMATPMYRASLMLNVEQQKQSPFDFGMGQPVYSFYNPEFIPTQVRLIRSREVAEKVVHRLNLLSQRQINPQRSGFFRDGQTKERSVISRPSADDVTRAALSIQGSVDAKPIRGTNLVELSAVSPSPKTAADVANAVAEAYIDWDLESRYRFVGQAGKFLTAQIEQLKSDIDLKEQKLQGYGEKTDIITIDPQSNITLQNLESLNRDYASSVADRVAKEARYHSVQTSSPEGIADTLSNGLVSQFRNEQAKLEREYAEKLNTFKPEWPAMQQLKLQIDKSKQNLQSVIAETVAKAREVARSEYLTARRREESLVGVLQNQKAKAMTLNSNAVEYNNLKVEISTKRELLNSLLKRQNETEVTSRLRGERVSNVRVVERALPPGGRYSPSHKRSLLVAVIVGLVLGLAFAFLLEFLDRSLRSVEQVEKYLKLPALGIIPSVGSAMSNRGYGYGYGAAMKRRLSPAPEVGNGPEVAIELIPHDHPRSTVAEAYRAFRAALLLSRAGGLKSIVITSTLPSEGKTSTALNLATVLGQLGKRVLLIDADLHKPRLHEVLRMSNRVGLVSILAESVPLINATVETKLPGVYLIPSGPMTPNPSGLLSSEAMHSMLAEAKAAFDYVIVDSPPVSPVADAILLGHQTDGVVICVAGGRTPRELVSRVSQKLRRSHVRILGVLLNNVEEHRGRYATYYRYYAQESYGNEIPAAAPAGSKG